MRLQAKRWWVVGCSAVLALVLAGCPGAQRRGGPGPDATPGPAGDAGPGAAAATESPAEQIAAALSGVSGGEQAAAVVVGRTALVALAGGPTAQTPPGGLTAPTPPGAEGDLGAGDEHAHKGTAVGGAGPFGPTPGGVDALEGPDPLGTPAAQPGVPNPDVAIAPPAAPGPATGAGGTAVGGGAADITPGIDPAEISRRITAALPYITEVRVARGGSDAAELSRIAGEISRGRSAAEFLDELAVLAERMEPVPANGAPGAGPAPAAPGMGG